MGSGETGEVSGMGIEPVVVAMIVLVTMTVIFASVGFMVQKRRSARRNAAGKELALLADARAVEYLARALLADCARELALHDALVPSDVKQLGYGKGILSAKIAVAAARGAQRAMEYGGDAGVAGRRLYLSKHAFSRSQEIAEQAKIMAAAQGPGPRPHLKEVPDVE